MALVVKLEKKLTQVPVPLKLLATREDVTDFYSDVTCSLQAIGYLIEEGWETPNMHEARLVKHKDGKIVVVHSHYNPHTASENIFSIKSNRNASPDIKKILQTYFRQEQNILHKTLTEIDQYLEKLNQQK